MPWGEMVQLFSFILNAIIVVVLLLFSRENLTRVRNILKIIDNGAYHDCPLYKLAQKEGGRRWYDAHHKEGGEDL